MHNITDGTKKLALKSELIKHLETAKDQAAKSYPSSQFGIAMINLALIQLEARSIEPNLDGIQKWLDTGKPA